jgi:Holliday junction resolvase
MPINSRQKGAAGERELADYLRSHGYEARRGQQFSGGAGSPDVVAELPNIHIECKRVEAGNMYVWMEQAVADAGDKIPVVFHRKNRKEWLTILRADDLIKLVRGF